MPCALKPVITVAGLVIALVVSGCGFISEAGSMTETMTEDEAAERVQEHINGTLAVLPEEAELEARKGLLFAACDDPTDGGSKGRVTVSERSWVRGLPVEDNEANIDLMYEYWTNNGYQVLRDERSDSMTVTVEHEEDAFRVGIRVSNKGSLSLGASSPCVRPDGEP